MPRCPSSPIVTTGSGGVVRAADILGISNNVGYRNVYGPRGSAVVEFAPWWATADLPAGEDVTLWHVFHDANNELRLFYRQSDSSFVFRLRRSGSNYDAVKAHTVSKFGRIRLGWRWCSSAGELGLAPYTVSIFVNEVKGTDAVAAGAITEADISRQAIGYRMRAWKLPSDVSGLTGWWKADAGLYGDLGKNTLIGSGDRVAVWADSSGNGRDMIQPNPGTRPIGWRFPPADGAALAAVDLPYVEFDASNDVFDSNVALSSFIAAGAGTMIAVVSPNVFAGIAYKTILADNGNRVRFGVYDDGSGKRVRAYNDDGAADEVIKSYGAFVQPLIALWWHGGGNIKAGVGDLSDAALVSAASGNTAVLTGTLRLGAISSSEFFDGRIMEAMTFNEALSESDRLDVASGLLHKWAGTVYAWNGFQVHAPYQSEWAFGPLRFLQVSQLVWSDAEIAAKHRAMAAVA